jgi:hypothetical protein
LSFETVGRSRQAGDSVVHQRHSHWICSSLFVQGKQGPYLAVHHLIETQMQRQAQPKRKAAEEAEAKLTATKGLYGASLQLILTVLESDEDYGRDERTAAGKQDTGAGPRARVAGRKEEGWLSLSLRLLFDVGVSIRTSVWRPMW